MEKSVSVDVDVIAQFNKDGDIIPLRIRVVGEDGEPHAYTIHGCVDMSHRGVYVMPDGMRVTNDMLVYECSIAVFEVMKQIHLYYNMVSNSWSMTV